jgi:protein-S-isoprenylcysteine O-methyltransferase Ste14
MTSPVPPQSRRFDLKPAASTWSEFQRTKLYDLVAGLPLTAWFALSVGRQFTIIGDELKRAHSGALDVVAMMSLLGKFMGLVFVATLLVLMIIRRPAKARAQGFAPRLCAFMGTYLSLAVIWLPPQPTGLALSVLSVLLMVGGLGFSVYAVIHLGRSFSIMAEARGLVVDGPYARIRHPLYLGEAVATLGLTLQFLSAFALLILSLQLAFQIIRMRNEESVLGEMFPEYGDYKMRTARLVPGLY